MRHCLYKTKTSSFEESTAGYECKENDISKVLLGASACILFYQTIVRFEVFSFGKSAPAPLTSTPVKICNSDIQIM